MRSGRRSRGCGIELTETDQRTFLRLAARYWEVHRHRMPPATARRVDALRSAGRLSCWPGG